MKYKFTLSVLFLSVILPAAAAADSVSPLPEPSSLTLFAMAGVGFMVMKKLKK